MNTQRKSILWLAICLAFVLIAVVIAFNAQIGTSTIMKDVTIGHFETGIGAHVGVILFVFVIAAVFLMLHLKIRLDETQKNKRWIITALFLLTGLLFAIATGYYQRFDTYAGFYNDMVDAPYWYSEGIIDAWYFDYIPQYAADFHEKQNTFFVLTVIAAIATVVAYVALPKLTFKTNETAPARCPRCNAIIRGLSEEFCTQCGARLENGHLASPVTQTSDSQPAGNVSSNGLKPTRWSGE